jgi:uncharacterized protein (DUF433 family)
MKDLIGIGIYSQPEAAHLLRLTPTRLRRWVNGYTYRPQLAAAGVRRSRPPVIDKSDIPVVSGRIALSFLELVELRVIRVLVEEHGIPLQSVRKAATLAQETFATKYPLASRTVYVEGPRLFASLSAEPTSIVELRRGRTPQIQWAQVFEPVMKEVTFDPQTSLTDTWWPLGTARPVVLDPSIMFGAPVIAGSRVRTVAASAMASTSTVETTAAAFGIEVEGVMAAVEFEHYLAAA